MEEYQNRLKSYQNKPEIHQHFVAWYQQNIQKKLIYLEQDVASLEYFVETGFLTTEELELFFNYLEVQTAINALVESTPTIATDAIKEKSYNSGGIAVLEKEVATSPTKMNFDFKQKNQREKIAQPPQKFGQYEVLNRLAEGGMGMVYKVRHQDLNTINALKVIIAGENASQDTIMRFHQEAKLTAKLHHPNIVQVLDFGQEGNQYYLSMEFVEGITLTKLIKQGLSIRNGLMLTKKVLDALEYAHQEGVLHRDLKPENIFVTLDNEPKIGDFGLAKDLNLAANSQRLTHSGTIMGTPNYMPPEQALGEVSSLDATADIYSMGVCLYEILTNSSLYEGENLHGIIYKILNDEVPPPSKKNPKIHRDLDTIVLKALEKQKYKRYQSAKEFSDDIQRFLDGYPIQAKSPTASEWLWKWVKRNRKKGMLVLFFAFLFLGTLVAIPFSKYLERKGQIDSIFSNITEKRNKAKTLSKKSEQIKMLLNALNSMNYAFVIQQNNANIEKEKLDLIQQLIPLACEQKAYELANYLAQEAQSLTLLPLKEKKKFFLFIEQAQTKDLKEQLKELNWWQEKLQSELVAKEVLLDAVFELSQMTEEKVFNRLLAFLEEAETYYLNSNILAERKCQFYQVVVLALGRLGNEKANETLLAALKKISHKVASLPFNKRSTEEITIMVSLTEALANLQMKNISKDLNQLRIRMGIGGVFYDNTTLPYLKLARLDMDKNDVALNDEEFYQQGFAKLSSQDYQGAILAFDKAIRLNPRLIKAYSHRGVAKKKAGDFDGAIRDYNIALKANPRDSMVLSNRGLVKHQKNDFDGAIKDYTAALEIEPNSSLTYSNRALSRLAKRDYKGTINDCDKAIKINPHYLSSYIFRAKAKYNLLDFQGCILDLNKLLELNPEHEESYFVRGAANIRLGLKKEAKNDFRTYLEKTRNQKTGYVLQMQKQVLQYFPELGR